LPVLNALKTWLDNRTTRGDVRGENKQGRSGTDLSAGCVSSRSTSDRYRNLRRPPKAGSVPGHRTWRPNGDASTRPRRVMKKSGRFRPAELGQRALGEIASSMPSAVAELTARPSVSVS
jgi:hypothetical protein